MGRGFTTLSPRVPVRLWAFVYNKNYTHRLLQEGYDFDDMPERVAEARRALGISPETVRA